MNKSAQISLRPGFHSLEHIFRSRIAGHCASSIFKYLRHYPASCSTVAVPFYVTPAVHRVPIAPHSQHCSLFSILFYSSQHNESNVGKYIFF